jgi:hypothetical protein
VIGLTPPVVVPMTRIHFQNDLPSVEVSGLDRVWKAGQGWVAVNDLKPNDEIRRLGLDRARVRDLESSKPQPGHNLFLAEGNGLMVGQPGLLIQDNTIVHPPSHPFDEPADPNVAHNPAR